MAFKIDQYPILASHYEHRYQEYDQAKYGYRDIFIETIETSTYSDNQKNQNNISGGTGKERFNIFFVHCKILYGCFQDILYEHLNLQHSGLNNKIHVDLSCM